MVQDNMQELARRRRTGLAKLLRDLKEAVLSQQGSDVRACYRAPGFFNIYVNIPSTTVKGEERYKASIEMIVGLDERGDELAMPIATAFGQSTENAYLNLIGGLENDETSKTGR